MLQNALYLGIAAFIAVAFLGHVLVFEAIFASDDETSGREQNNSNLNAQREYFASKGTSLE
jgi:hypothetical protein